MLRIGILSFAHLHAVSYIERFLAMPDVEFVVAGITDAAGRTAMNTPKR